MARIRLNNEYRNKIANRIKVHLQQEDTQEKRKYDDLKGKQIDINDNAWKVAETIVRRHYTADDVDDLQHLGFNGGQGGVTITEDLIKDLEEAIKNNYYEHFVNELL